MLSRYFPSKIVFYSVRDGNREIYVINPDGTEEKRLTNNPASDYHPTWSPDGQKIAFDSRREPPGRSVVLRSRREYEMYVMNADGTEQKKIANNFSIDISFFYLTTHELQPFCY